MNEKYDAVIVGGGASALAAAITAKSENRSLNIAILEKKDVLGKKLSQTGNGRCNISNVNAKHLETVMNFLSENGIFLTEEDGRLYPNSEDAKDVVSVLEKEIKNLGIDVRLNYDVKEICKDKVSGKFKIKAENMVDESFILADKVLIATGGKSYPVFGTTGDGYIFARKLGHSVTKLIPVLTGVEVKENISSLKGVRAKAKVSLYKDENKIFSEAGEVQFREDSISGICIMNLSREIKQIDGLSPEDSFRHYSVVMDMIPGIDITGDGLKDGSVTTLVKAPIANLIERRYKDADEKLKAIRNFKLTVKGLKGWNEAQVTSGGVMLKEVDSVSMESKIVQGLYFSGEVLDYDGPCGGYNLNFAWYTGILAGHAISGQM